MFSGCLLAYICLFGFCWVVVDFLVYVLLWLFGLAGFPVGYLFVYLCLRFCLFVALWLYCRTMVCGSGVLWVGGFGVCFYLL